MLTDTQTNTTTFSQIRSVLPESLVAALMELRERTSTDQWLAGDAVNAIMLQTMAHNLPISQMDICFYVSDFVYQHYAPNTLRIYAAVAKMYPERDREAILPFAIYRHAATLEQAERFKLFAWVTRFCDMHARPPSMREIREQFSHVQEVVQEVVQDDVHLNRTTPPEAAAIEQAIPAGGLAPALRGLLSIIPREIPAMRDPEAGIILAKIGALVRQLLEYL